MPWCPQCKAEYQEGYIDCRDCRVDLTDKLPVSQETALQPDENCEAFLLTASDNMQADFIESLLRAYHIPVLKKHQGIGNYSQIYWGFTKFGVDLFVPAKSLAEARDIVQDSMKETEDLQLENEEPGKYSYDNHDRKMRNWVVILCYFLSGFGLFFLLGYWFYRLSRRLNHGKDTWASDLG